MKDIIFFIGLLNFDRKVFNVYLVIYIGFMIKKFCMFGDVVIDCRLYCWLINLVFNVSIVFLSVVLDLLLILINLWFVNVICCNDI